MDFTEEVVINKILTIRAKKVMLDKDLADLYEVDTKALKQQVRRNPHRFPEDFMFELTKDEFEILRSQKVASSWGGQRYLPFAFTEQGVAMLSSVLNSKTAISVNIQIIRTFTKIREMLSANKDILLKLEQMERRLDTQDNNLEMLFGALKEMISEKNEPRKVIGFSSNK